MVEDVGSNELKRDHADRGAPFKIILKEPHARVAYHEPCLPSNVVFCVSF